MKEKKIYIVPIINVIKIDNAISMAMVTENTGIDPDDGWDDEDDDPFGAPPPNPGGNGNSTQPGNNLHQNTFIDNPFK